MATILCLTRWGIVLMLPSKYELYSTTQYWRVTAIFTQIRNVTLWPWPFDLGVMSRDATWVVKPCIPSLIWLQFSIDHQQSQFLRFLGKGLHFKFHHFNTKLKGTILARTVYRIGLMTYCVRGVSKCATCGPDEEANQKRTETFMRQTGYICPDQTTHDDVAPWNFACGFVCRK